ncbi:hemolysin family protein [Ferruginibacter lapsinanis]|uniref:hemolysin family protein n=1 Tax=Ferruginibacter lapsinanis TaxID=563172 RepID=UPI001E54B0C2|nr:hemolysin family protein [Ferruginibacter lapsinanis]UEG50499.1 hemolysin family protein [Ferruginibacter lapsinanis]
MDWIALFAIFLSLILIGFFSGIEIAFVSANKLSIELRKKQGTYSGKVWGEFAENPARFIGTTLIGFNIILVIYGLLWSNFMGPLWDLSFWKRFNTQNPYIRLVVETVLSTLCLLFFEFIFKAFFRAKNESILKSGIITYVVSFFYALLSWIANVFVDMAEWILRYIFNVKINEKKDAFTKIDLEYFVHQSKNHDEEDIAEINKELFENALSLSEIKIRECLIPRKEIEGVEINTPIETLKNKFIDTHLSKLVVYENNIDSIVGYVHQLDIFKNPANVKDILLQIPTIPESMNVTDLMNKFSKERKSIAWVIDEFGGTAGIVTMEDLLEEIFGDIKDEYDTEEFVEKQLSVNEFIFSGRVELDLITEKYKLEFPDSEATETLSGFIIQNRDEIPKQKETFTIGNYQFDILSVSDTRIETVKLKVLK